MFVALLLSIYLVVSGGSQLPVTARTVVLWSWSRSICAVSAGPKCVMSPAMMTTSGLVDLIFSYKMLTRYCAPCRSAAASSLMTYGMPDKKFKDMGEGGNYFF